MKSLLVLREWPATEEVVTIKTRDDAIRYGCLGLFETIARDEARRGKQVFCPAAQVKS